MRSRPPADTGGEGPQPRREPSPAPGPAGTPIPDPKPRHCEKWSVCGYATRVLVFCYSSRAKMLALLGSKLQHSSLCLLCHKPWSPRVRALSPLLRSAPLILGQGPLLRYYLLLTNYTSRDPISKFGHIQRCYGSGLQHLFQGDTTQPTTATQTLQCLLFTQRTRLTALAWLPGPP